MMSLLNVTVKRASYAGDQASQLNTYVTVKLQNVKSTTVTVKGAEPCWEQDFVFETTSGDLGLVVEVFSKEMLIINHPIGHKYIPLNTIPYGYPNEVTSQWYTLDRELVTQNGVVVGSKDPTQHMLQLDCRFELPYDGDLSVSHILMLSSSATQKSVSAAATNAKNVSNNCSASNRDKFYATQEFNYAGQKVGQQTMNNATMMQQQQQQQGMYGGNQYGAMTTTTTNNYMQQQNVAQYHQYNNQYNQNMRQDNSYEYSGYYDDGSGYNNDSCYNNQLVPDVNSCYPDDTADYEQDDDLYYNSRPMKNSWSKSNSRRIQPQRRSLERQDTLYSDDMTYNGGNVDSTYSDGYNNHYQNDESFDQTLDADYISEDLQWDSGGRHTSYGKRLPDAPTVRGSTSVSEGLYYSNKRGASLPATPLAQKRNQQSSVLTASSRVLPQPVVGAKSQKMLPQVPAAVTAVSTSSSNFLSSTFNRSSKRKMPVPKIQPDIYSETDTTLNNSPYHNSNIPAYSSSTTNFNEDYNYAYESSEAINDNFYDSYGNSTRKNRVAALPSVPQVTSSSLVSSLAITGVSDSTSLYNNTYNIYNSLTPSTIATTTTNSLFQKDYGLYDNTYSSIISPAITTTSSYLNDNYATSNYSSSLFGSNIQTTTASVHHSDEHSKVDNLFGKLSSAASALKSTVQKQLPTTTTTGIVTTTSSTSSYSTGLWSSSGIGNFSGFSSSLTSTTITSSNNTTSINNFLNSKTLPSVPTITNSSYGMDSSSFLSTTTSSYLTSSYTYSDSILPSTVTSSSSYLTSSYTYSDSILPSTVTTTSNSYLTSSYTYSDSILPSTVTTTSSSYLTSSYTYSDSILPSTSSTSYLTSSYTYSDSIFTSTVTTTSNSYLTSSLYDTAPTTTTTANNYQSLLETRSTNDNDDSMFSRFNSYESESVPYSTSNDLSMYTTATQGGQDLTLTEYENATDVYNDDLGYDYGGGTTDIGNLKEDLDGFGDSFYNTTSLVTTTHNSLITTTTSLGISDIYNNYTTTTSSTLPAKTLPPIPDSIYDTQNSNLYDEEEYTDLQNYLNPVATTSSAIVTTTNAPYSSTLDDYMLEPTTTAPSILNTDYSTNLTPYEEQYDNQNINVTSTTTPGLTTNHMTDSAYTSDYYDNCQYDYEYKDNEADFLASGDIIEKTKQQPVISTAASSTMYNVMNNNINNNIYTTTPSMTTANNFNNTNSYLSSRPSVEQAKQQEPNKTASILGQSKSLFGGLSNMIGSSVTSLISKSSELTKPATSAQSNVNTSSSGSTLGGFGSSMFNQFASSVAATTSAAATTTAASMYGSSAMPTTTASIPTTNAYGSYDMNNMSIAPATSTVDSLMNSNTDQYGNTLYNDGGMMLDNMGMMNQPEILEPYREDFEDEYQNNGMMGGNQMDDAYANGYYDENQVNGSQMMNKQPQQPGEETFYNTYNDYMVFNEEDEDQYHEQEKLEEQLEEYKEDFEDEYMMPPSSKPSTTMDNSMVPVSQSSAYTNNHHTSHLSNQRSLPLQDSFDDLEYESKLNKNSRLLQKQDTILSEAQEYVEHDEEYLDEYHEDMPPTSTSAPSTTKRHLQTQESLLPGEEPEPDMYAEQPHIDKTSGIEMIHEEPPPSRKDSEPIPTVLKEKPKPKPTAKERWHWAYNKIIMQLNVSTKNFQFSLILRLFLVMQFN